MKTLSEVKAEMLEKARGKPLGEYCILNREGKVLAHSASPFEHIYTEDADLQWAKTQGYKTREETMDDGRVLAFVQAKVKAQDLYQSADGGYYTLDALPENDDSFVTARYSETQKEERNQRISDTDDYERLSDITVQKAARVKREQLTDEEKALVTAYRQALRDWPQVEGFPFVEFPTIPDCIAYECRQKIEQREVRYAYA